MIRNIHLISSKRISPAVLSIYNRKSSSLTKKFWEWTSQERPSWRSDIKEAVIICTVFAISGSSSMYFIRPVLKYGLGLDGPFMESPVSYVVSSLLFVSPIYATIVFTVGTLAGRHIFFANMSRKVVGRFLPASLREKIVCTVRKYTSSK